MRYRLLCCEIFFREVCRLLSESERTCDVDFLPKGLHDLGADKMVPRLQAAVDAVPADRYEAVLLGYGLCNNGIVGLRAGRLPLVIPKSHDCIGIFMGSRHRYTDYFNSHPGTYYRTTGWTERNDSTGAGEQTVQQKLGLFMQYESLVEKYGEENARYIMETMGSGVEHYDRLTYIRMGLACEERFVQQARAEAAGKGWAFEELQGSLDVLRKLVEGQWDSDFLVVPPGAAVRPSHDDNVIACG